MRETLDEAIDRVASTLTAVSADSRFANRLDARLDERRSWAPIWLMAATATSVKAAASSVTPTTRGASRIRR